MQNDLLRQFQLNWYKITPAQSEPMQQADRIIEPTASALCSPQTKGSRRVGYLILSLLFLCGCQPQVSLVPVMGTVYLDDEPLTAGNIMVAPKSGPVAYGAIDANGSFTLQTKDGVGCVVGQHPVAITASEMTDGGNAIRLLVPGRYNDFASSGLTIEVTEVTAPLKIKLSSEGLSNQLLSNEGDIDL